jgi:hypothetical protein
MNLLRALTIAAITPILAAGIYFYAAGPGQALRFDICVYGGTSAGVMAAVAASRAGRSVVIVEPTRHLGGMTANGLGMTDFGDKATIGGLAREFYRRVGAKYGRTESWTFEPSVAESVFNEMVQESKVTVLYETRIRSTLKSGARIESVSLENPVGQPSGSIAARVYIDCSYEGDLMARSGVTYTVGREAVSAYGETLAGVRPYSPKHQFQAKVDPYLVPGVRTSGVIPLLQDAGPEEVGSADKRLPAYNFRLCLTTNLSNRLALEPPVGYDPGTYELLLRHIEALGERASLSDVLQIDVMPNGKTDVNNKGPISTDYIGESWQYPEASYDRRRVIIEEHKRYTQGLLYFLSIDPRLPAGIRAEMRKYGLCKDEFTDNANWPSQLYIREARRMIGAYVMTQKDCDHVHTAPDSIGMGSYSIDSHHVRRYVNNGSVLNEGDLQVKRKNAYPIPYSVVTPKVSECDNLLVPVCLSATHVAFSSVRMEPVFMLLGHAAGLASGLAADSDIRVQNVSIGALQLKLKEQGQVISVPANTGSAP